MPGTIQVSVLGFKGSSSSSPPSSTLIKVSMGKREYQTWDKGDFSFPLTTLRDNLIITLQDAEGNEISHTAVQSMAIVEKDFWDDLFPLEGGGHIHLKLQFILSKEERSRIQIMRESALKKKQGEILNSSIRFSETADSVGGFVSSSMNVNHEVSDSQTSLIQNKAVSAGDIAMQTDSLSNPDTLCDDSQSCYGNKEGTILNKTSPNATDRSEGTLSAPISLMSRGNEVHSTEVHHTALVEKIDAQFPHTCAPTRPTFSQEAPSGVAEASCLPMSCGTEVPHRALVETIDTQSPLAHGPTRPSSLPEAPSVLEEASSARMSHGTEVPYRALVDKVDAHSPHAHVATRPTSSQEAPYVLEEASSAPMSRGTEVHHRELGEKLDSQLPHAHVSVRPNTPQELSIMLRFPKSVVAATNKSASPKLEDNTADKPENQGPLERTPCNVRKMISAFESSVAQDRKPLIKPLAAKSQSNRVGMVGPLKDQDSKDVTNPAESSSERLKNPAESNSGRLKNPAESSSARLKNHFLTRGLQQTPIDVMSTKEHIGFDNDLGGIKLSQATSQLKESSSRKIQSKGTDTSIKKEFISDVEEMDTKEREKSSEDLTRPSNVEAATFSGRMHEEQLGGLQPSNLHMVCQDSGRASVVENIRKVIHPNNSGENIVEGASKDELKSLAYFKDEHNFCGSSCTWVFPDYTRHLCLTTGRKEVMDLLGSCYGEAKTPRATKSFSVPENVGTQGVQCGTDAEMEKGEKVSQKQRKSRPESSRDDASTGPVGQAIKIAIVVGFGILVFFTRQREPRKCKIKADDSFFTTTDLMDQE